MIATPNPLPLANTPPELVMTEEAAAHLKTSTNEVIAGTTAQLDGMTLQSNGKQDARHANGGHVDDDMTASASRSNHWQGILESSADAIGYTPVIKLNRLREDWGVKCNLLAKVEFFSAGGSIKDRIAKRMIEEAEKDGILIPGKSTIIEPTSGNTGIGLALNSALRGYRCIITLPQKMSLEKEATLKALGAEVIRTPSEAAWDSEESHIGIARKLQREIPGAVILDQYSNKHNPLAHYHSTYQEIKTSLETSNLRNKRITALVAGAGTGGTITGLSRAIRDDPAYTTTNDEHSESSKGIIVVGVDPEGSILGGGTEVGSYQVEGIGYDFVPDVLDPTGKCIDVWVKTNDEESFEMARKTIRKEALLIGGSCGACLAGAYKFLTQTESGRKVANTEDANVVMVLPDGIRNYIGKDWFLEASINAPPTEFRKEIDAILQRAT